MKFFIACFFMFIGLFALPVQTHANDSANNEQSTLAKRKKSPGNKTFYVNPVSGNDDRGNGTKRYPWKSFEPVNRYSLRPGDQIEILAAGPLTASLALSGKGTEKKPIVVKFAPGNYDWLPEKLLKRKLFISNANDVPDGLKAIAMELRNIEFLKIEGEGAVFFCRGKMIQVHLENAKNVKLIGFGFDYTRPTVSEYKVEKVAGDHALISVHKDSKYRIDGGKLIWVGEGWETDASGYGQRLDPDPLQVIRSGSPLGGAKQVEEISPFKLKASFDKNPGFEEGIIFQHRDIRRDCVGTFCERSENIIWDKVKIHFMHGMGVVSQFTRNITFKDVTLAPRKESGRTCASWADFLHFSGCAGLLSFDNVHFNGGNDDAINIHGTHLRITEKSAPKTLRVRFMHPQTFGFMAFNVDDEVEFIRTNTMRSYASAKVKKATLVGRHEMELVLDKALPEGIAQNDVLENVTWTAAVEIRNCVIDATPCRGFLLTTRRPILVENCTFNRCGMRGILVSDDASTWYESGMVKDLTIRKNTFNYCGEPVIEVLPENTDVREKQPVHSNIKIIGNTFKLKGSRAIYLKSCENIQISENTFFHPDKKRAPESFIEQRCADNVSIRRNNVKADKR